jgi:hypothetical protein
MMKVWYQLYLQDEAAGAVAMLELKEDDCIVNVRIEVKQRWGERIHCAAPELEVYPAGATVPTTDTDQPFPYWKPVSETTSSGDAPLIVLPQQDGESVRCSSSLC